MKELNNTKGSILVVDDTSDSLKLLTDILSSEGYTVRPADSGELALMAVSVKIPDIILLDFRMPGMDGLEVCRQLKANKKTRDIPVIFVSASTEAEERIEGLKIGAVDFINKPYRREELLVRIQTHLELHKLKNKLEFQIAERTFELTKTNETLQYEITAHKNLEESLRESETKFRAIFENSLDAIGVGKEGINVFVNPAYLRLFGYSDINEIAQRPIIDLIAIEKRPEILEFIKLRKLKKETNSSYITKGLKKDGTDFLMEVHASTYLLKNELYTLVILRDITAQKKAEEEVQKLNERFNLAAQAANIGVWDWDAKSNTLVWDDMMYSLYGVTRNLYNDAFKTWAGSIYFEDKERTFDEIRAAIADKKDYSSIYRIILPNGNIRHMKSLGKVYTDEEGKPLRMVGVNFDITESKETEELIREMNLKSEDALSAAKMAYWELDIENKFFLFNERFFAMHNISFAERNSYKMGVNEFVSKYVHPVYRNQVYELIEETIETKMSEFGNKVEARLLKTNGAEFWVSTWYRVQKNKAGKTIKLYGVNQDITEQKKAETQRMQSEENYRSLFNNMLGGFVYCKMLFENGDPVDFVYIACNEAFENMTGLKNVIGKKASEVMPGIRKADPELFITHGRVALTGVPEKFEIYIQTLDMWCEVSLYSPQKEYFVSVFDKITDRKVEEEKTKRALKEKEALIRELYHRTKNNMQVITSIISLKRASVKDENTSLILKEIEERIRAFSLVHKKLYQMQNLSKIDLKDYIIDLTKMLIKDYKEKEENISFAYELENVPVLIDSAIPCGLIINELVSNSIKYAFPNNMKGEIKIQLKKTDTDTIQLKVSDNGIGFQLNLDGIESLGLSIINTIAKDQLKGKFQFDTGNGVTFELYFSDNLYEERV